MTVAVCSSFLYWTWVASEVGVLVGTRTRQSSGEVRDRGSLLVLWVAIGASIAGAKTAGGMGLASLDGTAVGVAGVVIFIVGLAVRWTAILSLGRSFSANVAIHSMQTVYRGGLYRFVRHPSYTGLVLIFAAIGLGTRSWVGLAIMLVIPVTALLYRIRVEEAALTAAFGGEYVAYMRETKRLIPGVY